MNEDYIIKDVLKGTANTQEISEVVKWFATKEGQDFLSNDIDESIESLLQGDESGFAPSNQVPSDKIWVRINRQISFRRMRSTVLRIAAIAIPFFLLVAGWMLYQRAGYFHKEELAEIYVPKGKQQQITLEDGSRVYLNSDTRFRYPKHFTSEERNVYIEGEGYFEVAKHPGCPFVVGVGEAKVEVLGTSFNVEAYPNGEQIALQLDKGSIKLTDSAQKEHLMKPGEKLVYHRPSGTCAVSQAGDNLPLEEWEKQIFSFHHAPLSEVTETLKHWFDIDFQAADPAVWNYSYTFETGRKELAPILKDMEKVSPVRFHSEGKVIKISLE